MYCVYSCHEHDWRLVLLAAGICLLASLVAISLFRRAQAARGNARAFWIAFAGVTAGGGIWATHFIAMLAYRPGTAVAFEPVATALSLVIAIVITGLGLAIALSGPQRWRAFAGGAVLGAGIAAKHLSGMWAMALPAHQTWNSDLIAASILLALALGSAAIAVAARRGSAATLGAAGLLSLAVMSHHFTGMGALTIVADPTRTVEGWTASEPLIAFVVALIAGAVLTTALIGAIADNTIAKHAHRFALAWQKLTHEAEERQRKQHKLLETAIDNMSQGLVMFDRDLRLVVCNRRYREMYNVPLEFIQSRPSLQEILVRHFETGIFVGDAKEYAASIARAAVGQNEVTRTVETTDGRIISITNRSLADGGRVATHNDITESRRVERQIEEQRFQFDAALSNMRHGLTMFDADERLVIFNSRYLEMYRLSPDVVRPGCTLRTLIQHRAESGQLSGEPEAYYRRLISGIGNGRASSWINQTADGRYILSNNEPLPGGGWVGTHEDVTDRRTAEIRLREQKLHMNAAISNMTQGLIMLDADNRVILCNQRYVQMYGLPADAVVPGVSLLKLLELRRSHGTFSRDPQRHVEYLRTELAKGTNVSLVSPLEDGRVISVVNQPMANGGWVSTHEDITEHRQAEQRLREQKMQLDTALDTMSQGLSMFDAEGKVLVCNERYRQMYRLSAEATRPGVTVFDLIDARIEAGTFFCADANAYRANVRNTLTERKARSEIFELPDGRIVSIVSQPTRDRRGWVVTHEDITERRRAEEERDRSQAFATSVIDNVPVTILVKDARTLRYLLVNRAGEQYFGVSRDKMIGRTAAEVFPPEAAAVMAKHDAEMLHADKPVLFDDHPSLTATGEHRIVSVKRVPIRDRDGNIDYLLAVVEDRTNRKRAEAKIAHMAYHDPLTGIPNREAFNECLRSTIENAERDGNQFALMSIDIARLKEINDVFGYEAGDRLLCEMTQRVQEAVGGAFLARLGGDELSVIASEGRQPETAQRLADRILAAASGTFVIDGNAVPGGMSIGIAIYPESGRDSASLVANADAALYRAKNEARGSYRFFEPEMDRRLRERRILQQELRLAIKREELRLHYQPQAAIGGEVVGFEALVRWQHQVHGMISPGAFVPIAEESGLIVPMGEWVMRAACTEAASWPNPLRIGVNLSPLQFRQGDIVALVHTVLLDTGLAPSRLEIEITESVLIDDFARALSILRRLKGLGVRIAMDDFGTGYSSLSYLQAFPFDKIKIDQAFISNVEHNPHAPTIVRAVIGLARALDIPVLAEGVETEEQLSFLAKENCDEVQGYLLGRPKAIEHYGELTGRHAPPKLAVVGGAA